MPVTVDFPSSLPCVSRIDGFGMTSSSGVLRTPIEAGSALQRRVHNIMPTQIQLAWRCNNAQLHPLITWLNDFGYDWFNLLLSGLESSQQEEFAVPIAVRLMSDLTTSLMRVHRQNWWIVSCSAEYQASVDVLDIPDFGAVASNVDLVIQDAAHAHTADNLVLAPISSFLIAEGRHAHTADNVVLTGSFTSVDLTVQEATHAHTADNLTLELGYVVLAIADASHAHAADNVVLVPSVVERIYMDFEGSNGSTTFTDIGSGASTWSVGNGTPTIQTAVPLAGSSSLIIGSATADIRTSYSTGNRVPPTGDWLLSFKVRSTTNYTSGGVGTYIISAQGPTANASDTAIAIATSSAGKMVVVMSDGSTRSVIITGTTTLAANTTYDVQVTRVANTIELKLDGVSEGTGAFTGTVNTPSSQDWRIGGPTFGGNAPATMYFDTLRLSSTTSGLDSYSTGLKALHALKRKWTGYSGSCIRIRRSSDNTEQDIGFVSSAIDAAVDSTAAVSFASGGNAFVTTIYDQSGNGDHWIQATSAKQPRVVNAGVWDGFVRFDGSASSMESTNNSGAVQLYHIAVLMERRAVVDATVVFLEQGTSSSVDGNNDILWTYPGDVNGRQRLHISQNTNIQYTRFDATGGFMPSLTVAHMASWNFAAAGAAGIARLFVGATEASGTWVNIAGSISGATVGSAVKRYLAARNNASFFAPLNWAADAIWEGTLSDADKAAVQVILER